MAAVRKLERVFWHQRSEVFPVSFCGRPQPLMRNVLTVVEAVAPSEAVATLETVVSSETAQTLHIAAAMMLMMTEGAPCNVFWQAVTVVVREVAPRNVLRRAVTQSEDNSTIVCQAELAKLDLTTIAVSAVPLID